MTSVKNPYDSLYESLKDRFTVVCEDQDCTLGEYMLIQAGKKKTSSSDLLPTPVIAGAQQAVVAIVDYVATRLTVSKAPEREKTIRRFPLRSSLSAVFTAVACCALVFSFGIFTLKNGISTVPYTADSGEVEVVEDEYLEQK